MVGHVGGYSNKPIMVYDITSRFWLATKHNKMTHMIISACGVAEPLYAVGNDSVLSLGKPNRWRVRIRLLGKKYYNVVLF